MNNGFKITNGQVVFQFIFDIAWEIRIAKLLKSDIFKKKAWKIKDEPETTRKKAAPRITLELLSKEFGPFDHAELGEHTPEDIFTATLDDSGALALEFRMNFKELELTTLVKDSERFHENPEILANAKRIAALLLEAIIKFTNRPRKDLDQTEDYEDYVIYRLLNGFGTDTIDEHMLELASLIDGKRESLVTSQSDATRDYAEDVLQFRFNHPRGGLTIANWSGAICIGGTWDGVIGILLLANMELLELRLLAEHLTTQNDEFDSLSANWLDGYMRPLLWLGRTLLKQVLKTKRDVKDQLSRIKNPLVRFGNPSLAKIYIQLKEIFLIDYYMDEIKDELEELKDSESTISDRASARRQDVLAFLGVLVAFEYVTSGISDICKYLISFYAG